MLSVRSNEFFEFYEMGVDTKMSLFTRMVASYNRQNIPEEENKLLIKQMSNFFDSEFSFLYVKNINNASIDFQINFEEFLFKFNNKDDIQNVTIAENQEYLVIFNTIYSVEYKYEYSITDNQPTDCLFPELIELKECSHDPTNLSLYDWIYKKTQVDYSNILKKIDLTDAALKHLKAYYPKEIEQIENIPKLKDHDLLELEVKDKFVWGGDQWYIGEWRNVDGQNLIWGRGMQESYGIKFIGQFQNGLNGYGYQIDPDGTKIEGNFVNYKAQGSCIITRTNGKVEKISY